MKEWYMERGKRYKYVNCYHDRIRVWTMQTSPIEVRAWNRRNPWDKVCKAPPK